MDSPSGGLGFFKIPLIVLLVFIILAGVTYGVMVGAFRDYIPEAIRPELYVGVLPEARSNGLEATEY